MKEDKIYSYETLDTRVTRCQKMRYTAVRLHTGVSRCQKRRYAGMGLWTQECLDAGILDI